MKNIKSDGLTMNLEDKIKQLISEIGHIHCVKPDGKLDDSFILTYITQNNKRAAKDYFQVVAAYNKLKSNETFVKENSPKVSDTTLKKYLFYHDALVRPLKTVHKNHNDILFAGEILKLPEKKSASEYDHGEGWKALLEPERQFKIGDKVLYNYKTNIVLDHEMLHLVCSFSGKIIE